MEPTQALIEAVKAKAEDGRITCAVLRKLAEEQGVSYKTAGDAANHADIKIKDCGLGCF